MDFLKVVSSQSVSVKVDTKARNRNTIANQSEPDIVGFASATLECKFVLIAGRHNKQKNTSSLYSVVYSMRSILSFRPE